MCAFVIKNYGKTTTNDNRISLLPLTSYIVNTSCFIDPMREDRVRNVFLCSPLAIGFAFLCCKPNDHTGKDKIIIIKKK